MFERIPFSLHLLWWGIPKSDKGENQGTSWGHPGDGVVLPSECQWTQEEGLEADERQQDVLVSRTRVRPGLQHPSPEQRGERLLITETGSLQKGPGEQGKQSGAHRGMSVSGA